MKNIVKGLLAIGATGIIIGTLGAIKKAKKDTTEIVDLEKQIQELKILEEEKKNEIEEIESAIEKLTREILEQARELGMYNEVYAMIYGIRVLD